MKRGIIDRFENGTAVIEMQGESETVDFPRNGLPEGAKPGDFVWFENGKVRLDPQASAGRKKEIEALMEELFE